MEFVHKSVLFDEAVNALNLDENKIIVDGTAGGGGHLHPGCGGDRQSRGGAYSGHRGAGPDGERLCPDRQGLYPLPQ